jgi:hypothetical protein
VTGKAVVNPLMLCREGVMLLHEKASVYVDRSQQMAAQLAEQGLRLDLNPILRLRHEVWDAFAVVDLELRLPRHLSRAFGRERLTAAEFAAGWRGALRDAEVFLERCANRHAPRDAMPCLARRGYLPDGWAEHFAVVTRARQHSGEQIAALQAAQGQRLGEIRRLRATIADGQRGRGDDARPAQRQRLEEWRRDLRAREAEYETHKRELLALAQSDEHRRLQDEYRRLKHELALLRLEAVADALRVHALEHTNLRPSWWWFPALDPTGRWFAQVMATAEMRLEEWP